MKNMKQLKQLLSIMKPVRKTMALAVSLSFFTIFSNIALLATSAYLIAAAALHPPLSALYAAITGVRFFGLSRAFFRYGERYISHKATFQILYELRVWFYAKLEPLAPARLLGYRSGDLLGRIVSDVDTIQFFYLRVISPPLVAFLILIFMAGWFFSFGAGLALVLAAAFLLAGVFAPFFINHRSKRLAQEKLRARAFLKAQITDSLAGMTELAAFNQTERQADKLTSANARLAAFNHRLTALSASSDAMIGLITNLAILSLLLIAIPLAYNGAFEKVWLAVIVIAAQGSFEAVGPLALSGYFLDESLVAGRRLSAVTGKVPAVKEDGSMELKPDNFILTVSNLSFAYEPSAKNALSKISFELKPGQKLAVVGASGAGKSSLVNILSRFFEYNEGEITFGGHDLREYHPDNLRRYFAVVSQHSHIFNASLQDNIFLAKPSACSAEFAAAIKNAGLEDVLEGRSGGAEASAGNRGRLLSSGQRQRVAIARALLKNAPILILDEPTASLDAITAQKVMAAIFKLMEGRASILITHDLTGMEAMDEIIVLDHGVVAERGSQQDLLNKKGLFAEMYYLQQDVLNW